MATRRPSNRDRAAVSDQRAVARHKLETEVRETSRRLIVTMPGTHHGCTPRGGQRVWVDKQFKR
jgi:hypothetical protein